MGDGLEDRSGEKLGERSGEDQADLGEDDMMRVLK